MGKKVFTTVALHLEDEAFIVHIVFLAIFDINKVYPSHKLPIAILKVNKALTTITTEYSNFVDVFSPKVTGKLPKYTKMNNYTINLVNGQEPSYGLIFSLGSIEFEIIKA